MSLADVDIGMKVMLNSGGPEMTILAVDPSNGYLYCCWINDDRESETASFHPATVRELKGEAV